jgi:LETM1 and EF-hand domain-containing protein 1
MLGREMRVAGTLVYKLYAKGHDLSRQDRRALKSSAKDLVRVLPVASMFMVFGLELSTIAILRYVPGLLPKAVADNVVPAAGDLGIVNLSEQERQRQVDAASRTSRIARISGLTKDMARSMSSTPEASSGDEDAIISFIDRIEDPTTRIGVEDILMVAPLFRKHMTMDKLPREQLVNLCKLHPGVTLNLTGSTILSRAVPSLLLARSLRGHLQRLRADDKEIYWEGVDSLNDAELGESCEQRGLVRGGTYECFQPPSASSAFRLRLTHLRLNFASRFIHPEAPPRLMPSCCGCE